MKFNTKNSNFITAALLLSVSSFESQASLTVTANGLGVYDSGIDATWTQDANLLGTLEGSYKSLGYNNIVNDIINANAGVIHDTPNGYYDNGTYTLTTSDFGSGGTVSWYGAQAFVHYLNTQNYAGSNQWALPFQPIQSANVPNLGVGYQITYSQLGELFYSELKGSYIPPGPFSNLNGVPYWFGTEYAAGLYNAWYFFFYTGLQTSTHKDIPLYAWAVSPGIVGQLSTTAVPLPSAVWLFGACMLGLLGLKRRDCAE